MSKSELQIAQGLTERLLLKGNFPSTATIKKIEHIIGDASSRRYYRIHLEDHNLSSVVLVVLAGGSGPIVGGDSQVSQDDTYVEVGKLLRENGVAVPELYVDGRHMGALLIEDVGDGPLWKVVLGEKLSQKKEVSIQVFKLAIDEIHKIRGIAPEPSQIAFKRFLGADQLFEEASRFIKFYLSHIKINKSSLLEVERFIRALADELAAQKTVLSHRDFMAWNLHLDGCGKIRVLDFQDALLAPPCYDVISLLYDRDIDLALGDDCLVELAEYFRMQSNYGKNFKRDFVTALLQRSLRIAGQFVYLSDQKNNPVYRSWVPGRLRLIGRCLATMSDLAPISELLGEHVEEIKYGITEPLRLS